MDIKNDTFIPLEYESYVKLFDALSHPMRIKIIGILAEKRQYVSELARMINISRPLLYMHLKKLEAAGLVSGQHEISKLGKATKYYEVKLFDVPLTLELLTDLSKTIPIAEKKEV